jgi:hypothetical protein
LLRIRTSFVRAALLAAVLPSTVLAACGGGDEERVAVDVWVRSLCSAANRFDRASDAAGEPFIEAANQTPGDTVAIKAAFAKAIEEQKKAQQAFRSDFNDLGKPDVDDADAVIKAFRDQFEENNRRTDTVARQIAAIDDSANFFEAFDAIEFEEPEFRAKLEPLASGNSGVQQIIDAIDANADCAAVIFNVDPGPDPITVNPVDERWASGICTALYDWILDLELANDALQIEADFAETAEELKEVLITFLEQGLADTEQFQARVRALQPPQVGDGQDIHRVFVGVADELVLLFEDFVDDATAVDASTVESVTADLEAFERRVTAAFDEVGQAFNELDQYDPEGLADLFATLPECAILAQ